MLRIAVRLLVPVILVAVIASTCGDGYSPDRIPDGGPPVLVLLDKLDERGGILHLQSEQFTRLGVVSSPGQSTESFRLPEHLINDQWILIGGGAGTTAVGLQRELGGTFIARFRSQEDGAYVSEHVPSGTISESGPRVDGVDRVGPPRVVQTLRDNLARIRTTFEDEIAAGRMTLEPSGNIGTIILVRPRAGGCARGMSVELPAGIVEERTEVTETDYVTVHLTCILTTPDGREILINEDTPRFERLDADRWDDIVSFVFGG